MSFTNKSNKQLAKENTTLISGIESKLNSTADIHVSSIETPSQSYTLSEVLDQTLTNKVGLASTNATVTGLTTSKQNNINYETNLIMGATNTQSIINEGTLLQKAQATFNGRTIFQGTGSTYYKDLGGATTAIISSELGIIRGLRLEYDDNGSYLDVKAQIDALNAKLSSTASILTSSIESADQEYDLNTLLERVITNKVKLETFVQQLDGAVGDTNVGVVSLMEQVSQNVADLVAETTARISAINNEATARANADTTLNARVLAVETLQASDNTSIVNALTTETASRIAGDALLQSALDTQVSTYDARVVSVDSSLSSLTSSVTAEAATRASADALLNTRVGNLETQQGLDVNTVTSNLSAEVTARTDADAVIQSALDAHIATYDARVTAVDTSLANIDLSGAVADANTYTDTQVGIVTTSIATEQASSQTKYNTIASTRHEYHIVEGEGDEPVFTCGNLPMMDDFGLPMVKASQLDKVGFIAITPDASITNGHTMTLQFDVWSSAGTLLSSTPISFVGRRSIMSVTTIALPVGCNVVVKYTGKTGVYHVDSRFRLSLQVRATDIDSITA